MKKLKEQLKSVSKSLASLSKQVDKITAQVDKFQPPKAAPAKKAAAKKAAAKKTAAKKTAPAPKVGVLDSVFDAIRKASKGINVAALKAKTGLNPRQLSNALYKLSKKDTIIAKARGLYFKK